jgi:hypothetical protein
MIALTNRAHMLARPHVKEQLESCFTTVLGCAAPLRMDVPGLPEPILAFRFPGGGSVSVEFTEDALDEQHARHGAWLEVSVDDAAALKQKVLDAGLPQVKYGPAGRFYFVIPGGQVMGIA